MGFAVGAIPLFLLLLSTVSAVKTESARCMSSDHPDHVSSLPGFNQPLPSKWFSGYLDYEFQGQQIHTHYLLVQAEELGDQEKDKPLIYWSNGGPGASSMFGLLTELGPLILSDLSLETEDYKKTGIPTPIYNPHAWSRLGSILIIDQPAPVGFSFCNDDTNSSPACSEISWTDELASQNAYLALQTFFATKFPCLQHKELYLTGESYAGIYIPTLARQILQATKNDNNNTMNLQGFAVGDGCLGTHTSICGRTSASFADYWHALFMAGHHQIPWKDFEVILRACHHSNQPGFSTAGSQDDENCKKAMAEMKQELGGVYAYHLYDDCAYRNGVVNSKRDSLHGALNDYPCGGDLIMNQYLKLDAVRQALHLKSSFSEGAFNYTPTEPDLTGFYKSINGKLKVLIYNGDVDPMITSHAAHNWTSHMGFQEIQHWRPWTVDGCQRMGGYVTRYHGKFDFLTIRGAGHMVPTNKPEAAYTFLKAWVDGDDYPSFNPNCAKPTT